MKQKNKLVLLKYVVLCFTLFFIATHECKEAFAINYIFENWDSGTPPANWPNCGSKTSFNGWDARSWDCDPAQGNDAGLSTTIYHSPPRSYHNKRHANQYYAAGDLDRTIPGSPPIIYIRFYAFFASNWSQFDPNPALAGEEFIHFLFLNTALAQRGLRLDIYDHATNNWPYECISNTEKNIMFNWEDNGTPFAHGSQPNDCWNLYNHLNEWHAYEFMIDSVHQKYSMWVDGVQKVRNVTVKITDLKFKRIFLSLFSSYLRNYDVDFYIDDIVISDRYIGLMPPPNSKTPKPPVLQN